jgi:hypothetical protein
MTIGVTGCSDRQKRKEQRQAGSGSQRPFGLCVRLLLRHLENDIESDRDPERKARNADYQPNRCFLDAKDISKQTRDVRDLGWATKSPAVAMNTLWRTTPVTLSSEPRCSWP